MNPKNKRTSSNDDDDEEEDKEDNNDDHDDDDHEKNPPPSGHTKDDNHGSDWPDLDHLISPDEHLNFVLTFNGNDGDDGDDDLVQSSEPPETSAPPPPPQQHQRLPVPVDDPPYHVLGPVNFGPMSEGLMDSVVSEQPSRTTTTTATTTTNTTTSTTTSTTAVANGFGQQMFSLSQTISHFMLCLGIVGSAFFITGTCLLMMVSDHIILAIVCILLGCFSLCSSIIYFTVYFLNECTQLIPTKQNKYEINHNCGHHVQNHDNHQQQAINQLQDETTNCSPMSNEHHDHPIQNPAENPLATALVDEEPMMTSLNPTNSFLNVEHLDRVQSSSNPQRPNQNLRKNQQPTNKQRANIFAFCGHKRGGPSSSSSSSFTNAKSDSKSELLVNEYENENMLFDVDRIGLRRSSSLEILFDQHHHNRAAAAVDGGKDDWKIVMKNGSNGTNGGSNSGPFMIVQFNKDHAI